MALLVKRLKLLFTRPQAGAQELLEQGSMSQALKVFLCMIVLSCAVSTIVCEYHGYMEMLGSQLKLNIFMLPILWWAYSATCYALSKTFGGRGDFQPLFMMFGYISSIYVPLSVLTILGMLIGGMGETIEFIIKIALLFWGLLVASQSLQLAMKLSTKKAIVICFIPAICILLFIASFILLFYAGALS